MSFKVFLIALLVSGSVWAEEPTNPQKIVVLGDSIAAGYGVSRQSAFPTILEKLLLKKKQNVKVVNIGISGSTTASALQRLKWQLRAPMDILILELGANDGLRGIKIKSSKENLRKTIQLAKSKKIKILLTGMMLPKNYGPQYVKDFENMFVELSKEEEIPLMPFLLKDVGAIKKYNLPDGIHPNEKGHQIIGKNLLPYVEKLL